MKRKQSKFSKISASLIAVVLVFSLCMTPFSSVVVYAENETIASQEEENTSPQYKEGESNTSTDLEDADAVESVPAVKEDDADAEGTDADVVLPTAEGDEADEGLADAVVEPQAANEEETGTDKGINDFDMKLLYGDEGLNDADALVLTFLAEGFKESELGDFENPYVDSFWYHAKIAADYMMKTSPWDEFKDNVKIYGIGTISKDSGSKGCDATTAAEAAADDRDTYFRSYYWSGGMERSLVLGDYGRQKVDELMDARIPSHDYEVVLVNSKKVGGTGGQICIFSIDPDVYECTVHELGHTVAKLADEYWPGYGRESWPNMTSESDPEKVKWSRFIGKNGVGVYEYGDGGNGWYRPSQNCKMQFLGEQFPLCEVCKEATRDKISELSNVQNIAFQTYADVFHENDDIPDMYEYFILRKGEAKKTGADLKDAGFTLTYMDNEGNVLSEKPIRAGKYKVKGSYPGGGGFDACELTAEYTVGLPNAITITASNKVYDGKPVEVAYEVDKEKLGTDKAYTTEIHYTGANPYATGHKEGNAESYDSKDAPYKPGEYTVTVILKDSDGTMLAQKSAEFTIDFKMTPVVDHEDTNYRGASSMYNNKTIVITGEGYTAQEQDKFEAKAAEFINYIRNTEPYKELDLYFNYTTVQSISDESGIGTSAKNTYYRLTRDASGKIVEPAYASTLAAHELGFYKATHYYQSAIVIVNDENAKTSIACEVNEPTSIKHRVIYAAPNENGMKLAAQEILNRINSYDLGYAPTTDEQRQAQRDRLLELIVYGTARGLYAPVLSDAYKTTFVENGKPVDLSDSFKVYVGKTPIPSDKISFDITYYTDDNGKPGQQLDAAPSKAGTYHALAVTKTNNEAGTATTVDLSDRASEGYTAETRLWKTRGWTTFTIQPAGTNKPAETTNDTAVNAVLINNKAKVTQSGAKLKVSWSKVSGAEGYDIYAAKCGSDMKLVKSVKGSSKVSQTISKIGKKKISQNASYKVQVNAYCITNGKKKTIAKSMTFHVVGKNKKGYTNAKSIKVAKSSVALKQGKTKKIKAKTVKQSLWKKLLPKGHIATYRYYSTNQKVATVSSAGTIKAKGKGKCTVYVVAANGVKKAVKVTVK